VRIRLIRQMHAPWQSRLDASRSPLTPVTQQAYIFTRRATSSAHADCYRHKSRTHGAEATRSTERRATPARGGGAGTRESERDPVAVTSELFGQLAAELTRWFGPFGYHALFSRALAEAKSQHPALENVQIRSASEPSLDGLAESVERHGADAITEGIIAMLVAFIGLLSRLIGEDMALKLLDQPEKEGGS
jgi:hypothetical protein